MKEKISSADSLEREFISAIRSLNNADFLALAAILGSYDEGRGKVTPILSEASTVDLCDADRLYLFLCSSFSLCESSLSHKIIRKWFVRQTGTLHFRIRSAS